MKTERLNDVENRGNEYSKAEGKANDDFFNAAKMMAALLTEFHARDMDAGPAIGGALTQILAHIIEVSPDVPSALGLISSCLSNAAYQAESPDHFIPDPDPEGLIH